MDDLISRQAAIDAIENTDWYHQNAKKDMVSGANPDTHQAWYKAEDVNNALESVPSAQPQRTGRWSGLWSEPQDDNSIYGEKLMEGDTIYLLGVEGTVTQDCGAWGWGSPCYVPWDELEKRMPHGNSADFCFCDNFVSFWELKWNFDDGYDWDGVPFIRHGADMRGEQNG